ncbi:gem-associated protein 5 [Caerostris darwini]|uniref:Gem-associated protein 5 n=1 Tax=Caerostris darwini TaxID=1538125 RepID=A0AAV4VT53_9ARAC|nr:gem-associated protein 5 [Caerostris darwini]
MASQCKTLGSLNYSSYNVISQNRFGILAYSSRLNIYFVDLLCNPPLILDSKTIVKAHNARIISLSFNNCEDNEFLASVGENNGIKVWDTKTGDIINASSCKDSTCIEWIHGSPNTLIFVLDPKYIVKWNVITNSFSKIKTNSDQKVSIIVSNSKSPHLLALGHYSGAITILDIVQETVLKKLISHSNELTSLSWSSTAFDMLVSASLDLSLRVWKIDENKPLKVYKFPTRGKVEEKKRLRIMAIFHPSNTDVIICNNIWGEVGEVIFSEEGKPNFTSYSKTVSAIRGLQGFFTYSKGRTDENKNSLLFCFDINKLLIWNVVEKKCIMQLPFVSGTVKQLANSTTNPNLCAICPGDGIVRILNTQTETNLDMSFIFVNYKTKILCASWHPILENILAFGTSEGRIGVIDIFKRKLLFYFETFHAESVYSMCWGPYKNSLTEGEDNGKYFLYSCGGGIVYLSDFNRPNESSLNISELLNQPSNLEKTDNSSVCWKNDYSCICFGTFKGFIDVYNVNFDFLIRYEIDVKTTESIIFHPESTYVSPEGSPLRFWLACQGNNENIYICDTSKIFEKENIIGGPFKKLSGHKKNVTSICWSQHIDGQLVSGSKDGSIIIWNVSAGTIIASYTPNREMVCTVQWSTFDQDAIYSAGFDSCVRTWKISEHLGVQSLNTAPRKHSNFEAMVKVSEEASLTQLKKNPDNLENSSRTNVDNQVSESKNEDSLDTSTINWQKGNMRDWKEKNREYKNGLFPYYSTKMPKEAELKDCIQLANILSKKNSLNVTENEDSFEDSDVYTDDEIQRLGLYINRLTTLRMVEMEVEAPEKFKYANNTKIHLSVMAGKIKNILKNAAENGKLTHYHISIAPSVSYSFWLELCEKFATQLILDNRPYEACTYFLICNKLYEAINVLMEKGNVVDALVLAKSRLLESDPLITKLIMTARKKFILQSDTMKEIKCYLTLNNPMEAVKTLASLKEPIFIKAAIHICRKYHLNKETEKYIFEYMMSCLLKSEWNSLKQLIEEEPNLQVYNAMFIVHEAFHHHILQLKNKHKMYVQKIFCLPDSSEPIEFWAGEVCKDSKQSFIEYCYDLLLSKGLLSGDKGSLQNSLEALEIMLSKWKAFDSSYNTDAFITISIYITKFILLSVMEEFERATVNYLKALDSSFDIAYLPKIFCSLCLPLRLLWNHDTRNIMCEQITVDIENDSNNVLSQFKKKFRSISDTLVFPKEQSFTVIFSKEDLYSNLCLLTDKIGKKLSVMDMNECILAYFLSYLINDLLQLVGKKDLKLKCFIEKDKEVNKNSLICNKSAKKTAVGEKSSLEEIKEIKINDESPKVNETSLQDLIDLALIEADKKTQSLIELETSGTSESNILKCPANEIPYLCADEICLNNTDTNHNLKEHRHKYESNKCENIVKEDSAESDKRETIVKENSVESDKCDTIVKENSAESDKRDTIVKEDTAESDKSETIVKEDTAESETIVKEDSTESDKSETIAKEVGAESEISENTNSHSKCLANIDLFYNLLSFIVYKICQEEFTFLPYLKKRLKYLNTLRATEELNKFSKRNKIESNSDITLKSLKDIQNKTESPPAILNKKLSNGKSATSDVVEINTISDKNEQFPVECPYSSYSFENSDIPKPAVPNNIIKVEASTETEPSTQISTESELMDDDKSKIIDQVSSINLLKNLAEISVFIHLLESKSKELSYPSPFDIIPKVLQILYIVKKKSPCGFVQEKLHKLIHEIISWIQVFTVADETTVCEICHM